MKNVRINYNLHSIKVRIHFFALKQIVHYIHRYAIYVTNNCNNNISDGVHA